MPHFGIATTIVLGISQTAYLVAMLVLGARLARLARRTHELPEALLAVHFVLCCGLGYALLGTGYAIAMLPATVPARLVGALVAVGQIATGIGVLGAVGFTALVFRRGVLSARILVAIVALLLVAGAAGYGLTGGFSHGRPQGGWFWLSYGTWTAAAVWVMAEPFAYWLSVRRRIGLGLADPVVVERVLLWAIGSLLRCTMLAVGAVSLAIVGGPPESVLRLVPPTFVATGVAGLGVAVCYGLAFFPPRTWAARSHAETPRG